MIEKYNNRLRLIETTFNQLVIDHIDFLLLRGREVLEPQYIHKDFDILVNLKDYSLLKHILIEIGYEASIIKEEGLKFLYGASPSTHFRIKKDSVHLDVVTCLQYLSLDRNAVVAINPALQNSIFKNKRTVNQIWKFEASYEDELTHLCCRLIFDYNRIVQIHKLRIEKLLLDVDENQLLKNFKLIFGNFAEPLLEYIKSKNFDSLYDNYIQFKNY